MNPIEIENVSSSTGRIDNGWGIYIPTFHQGGMVTIPPPGAGLLSLRVKGKTWAFMYRVHRRNRLSDSYLEYRNEIRGILQTNFGLSRKASWRLTSKDSQSLKRIDWQIQAIIDCLLLSFPMIFSEDNRGLVRAIFRKALSMSVTDVDGLTKHWKSFSTYVYAAAVRLEVLTTPELESKNFFKFLLGYEPLLDLIRRGSDMSKSDLSRLAHLVSTRGLAPGGGSVSRKALKDFQTTLEDEFNPSPDFLDRIFKISEKLGRKCLHEGASFPDEACHISLSMAGSFDSTVLEGGRANDIMNDVIPILTFIPEVDEVKELPFIRLFCPAGIPRWRSWCRESPLMPGLDEATGYFFEEIGTFMSLKPTVTLGVQDRMWGLDQALGLQIYTCAYLTMLDSHTTEDGILRKPLPCRVLTVPEPGGKVRIVSTTEWWAIILQQPLGHILKNILLAHPSATDGLKKADQAWCYVKRLAGLPIESRNLGFSILSSDLKEASDSIPPVVAERVLTGFLEGIRYGSTLIKTILSISLGERLMITQDSIFLKKRGVLMGEPITKVTLTLMVLIAEELSIRDYFGDEEGAINASWRCFCIGGDDHIAHGPRQYLEGITAYLQRLGLKVSPDKHGTSNIAVRYCEKFIDVRRIGNQFPKVVFNPEGYALSPFVDSIKVRLLSPFSKSLETVNDRNAAIGKGLSLASQIRYIETSGFPKGFAHMVRDRFWNRMGGLLHDSRLPEASLRAWLYLPQALGGLDMWLHSDLPFIASNLPNSIKRFVRKLVDDPQDPYLSNELRARLRRLSRSSSIRGYGLETQTHEFVATMIHSFIPQQILGEVVREIRQTTGLRLGVGDSVMTALEGLGYYTEDALVDLVMRGYLFADIMAGKARHKAFNTESWKMRLQRWWSASDFDGGIHLIDDKDLRLAFDLVKIVPVFNIGERTILTDNAGNVLFDKSIKDELLEELPTLSFRKEVIGARF